MRPEDTAAVLRVKAAELTRQLDALTTQAAELRRQEASLATPSERFALLHHGLTTLAAQTGRVFEDASFADGLAEEIACGTARDEAIQAGAARLSGELTCATRRGAAASLYSRLFEPSEAELETTGELPGRSEAVAALVGQQGAAAGGAASATVDVAALRELLTACAGGEARAQAGPTVFDQAVSHDEVRAHLRVLSRSFDHRAELRAYCRRLTGDAEAVGDLAGALTVLARDLDSWRWEDWPTAASIRWNRTRWRAFLDPELIPQLLLEVVALRLGVWARTSWLPRTVGARRRTWDFLDHRRAELTSELVFPGIGRSTAEYAQQSPNDYAGAGSITGAPDRYQRLFQLLVADIWWHKETSPGEPLYVAQTDVASFFPSLPHATVAALLSAMGVPDHVAGFVSRYLSGPYQCEGETLAPTRGMFPGNTLSRVLADALLVALDSWVEISAGVPLSRFMDDIYWVTPEHEQSAAAWVAIQHFCRTAGLETNLEKSALFRLGEGPELATPPGLPLPSRRIRWAFLELDDSGTWAPRQEAIEEFLSSLRTRLAAPAPVRQLVREYNAAIGYLVRGLAPLAPLGAEHAARLRGPLGQIHAALFGPGRGVVEHVRERLATRCPQMARLVAELPDAWFYWPITAGGLGLYNPASLLAGARAALQSWQAPSPPPLAEGAAPRDDASWTLAYRERARVELRAAPPTLSPAMEGRQRDFIARGGEVQGRKQTDLHAYWQWLLETHAPSLLAFFGTLRFLPTEVVPVQPIGASPRSLVQDDAPIGDDDIPF
jgi:hypothetical protein